MDTISDILPPVLLAKLENAAKDRNQKNKNHKKADKFSEVESETTDSHEDNKARLVSKTSTWSETDRRSTNDRRRQMAKRGRWLESRNSTDRRKVKQAISITI